jgi:hypothetical protein
MVFMKKYLIGFIIIALLAVAGYFFFTGDRQNKIARMKIEQFTGNYTLIWTTYQKEYVYNVTDGKITADPIKGYYFFWADATDGGKPLYTQIPITQSGFQARR